MAEFTASPDVSGFAPPNQLFNYANAVGAAQGLQSNQLGIQGKQIDLANAGMEQVGRAAAGLLSAYPDEASRALAYPKVVGMLQSQGVAMNAPSTYPGEGALRMLATQAIPAAEQYKLNLTKAGADAIWPTGPAPTATAGAPGSTTGAAPPTTTPPGSGATIGQRQHNPGNLPFAGQPGASPVQGNRFASFPDMPTGVAANADQLALYQTQHGINTVRGAVTRWVSDPKADLTSYIGDISNALGVKPDDPIDLTDPAVQAKFIQAQFPHESAGGGYVLNPADVAKGVQMSAANRGRTVQVPGTAIATAAPATAQPGQPVPTQIASNTPMVSTAPPAPTAPPGAPAQPPATAAAPAQPGQPQPAPVPATAQPTSPGRVTPPPAPTVTIPPRVPLPAAPAPTYQSGQYQGLTPDDVLAINRVAQAARVGTVPATAIQTEIDSRRNKNIALAQTYQAAVEKQRADDIATEQLKLQGGDIALKTWQAANPTAKITQVGGDIITQDPHTGQEIAPRIPVNANREDLAAALTVARLGPRIAAADAGTGPPVSPEDRAAYAVQANAYQQFKEVTDPISKQVKSVPTRPLPPNFPGTAAPLPLTQGLSPSQQEIERDPAAFEVNKRNYNDDATDIRALSTSGRQLQSDQVRVKQMQDVLQGFTSGPGTEARTAAAAWFQRWLPSGLTGWEKEPPTLSGAAAAQEFQKLALGSAGQQDQALLGKNAGYRSLELFRNANPNSELLDPTNAHILDMQLVQNQANQDYIQAAQAHFKQNEQAFKTTHQYNSLNDFDADWGAKRNPQVYAAAIGAIAGQPVEKWAEGLSKDGPNSEYAEALKIVQRAKPTAVVNGLNGRRLSMQPNQAPNQPSPNAKPMPPGFSVVPQ